MENKQSQINIPMLGMDRDSHPNRVKENSYVFAKNINLEDSSGNGLPVTQNEPSNLLCQNFGEAFKDIGNFQDYKVVGYRFNANIGRTYFMFVNENKEDEEFYQTSVIGYISQHVVEFQSSDTEVDCNCVTLSILDEPLEGQVQESLCNFKIIVEDSCNKCLGFSTDNPIFERNIRFKNEQCGRRMYWTDRNGVPRFLDLDLVENQDWEENIYFHTGQIVCGEEVNYERVCFDCEKTKMIPDYEIPCLLPTNIVLGGNLKLGTYEFLIAYCDEEGNELSNYFSHTNPIALFDYANPIMNQTELDRVTNYAIELKASNLDEDFHFYKIAVIQHTDVNGEPSYFEEGIHPITDETILYTTEGNKKRTTLNKLLIRRVKIKSVEHMVDSNGFLFMAGIKNKPVMNLQPIVSLMGAFMKWTSIIAKEDFYKNGINASNNRSYMRDEVYPLSLTLGMEDGSETNDTILINRFATPYDIKKIGDITEPVEFETTNLNVRSILKGKNACGGNERKYRWQFENTAQNKGFASIGTKCETAEDRDEYVNQIKAGGDYLKRGYTSTCSITAMDNLNVLKDIIINVPEDKFDGFKTLEEYLNGETNGVSNLSNYMDPINPDYNSLLGQYLTVSRYSDYHCSTLSSCNCNDEELNGVTLRIGDINLGEIPVMYSYVPYELMGAKPLPFTESLFLYNQRDADSSFGNKYIYRNFAQAAYRGVRKIGNSYESPQPLKILADVEIRAEEGFTLPNVGVRQNSGENILTNKGLFFTGFTAATIPNTHTWQLDPMYLSSYTNDKKDDDDFNFREVWGVIRTKQKFQAPIAKNALWVETKDISEYPYLEINFKTSDETYGLDNNTDTLDSLTDYNASVITVNSDLVTNRIGKVRISIFPSGTLSGAAVKTIFLDKNTDNFINLKTELGLGSGTFLISIDTPVQQLEAYTMNYNRNFWKSGLMPGVTETPEIFRLWGRRNTPEGTLQMYDINRGNSTGGSGFYFGAPPNIDDVEGTKLKDDKSWTTTSVDYSFMIIQRGKEIDRHMFNVTDITIIKDEEYSYDCYFEDLDKKVCEGQIYEEGSFSYWESQEEYPDNDELYNSSKLQIVEGETSRAITESDITELVNKYVSETDWDGNVYSNGDTFLDVFKQNFSGADKMLHPNKTNFTCKPIRHFKFPSSEVSPPIFTDKVLDFSNTYIFPLGVTIEPAIVNLFLDLAVKTGQITQAERASIVSFKIKRGDRTVEKSVLSKGLLSDMIKYKEEGQEKYIPNFPFNSLSPKELILQGGKPLAHQHRGTANNLFAFNSPEIDYGLDLKPSEIYIDGYQYGEVEGKLSQVDEHAKMVILSESAHQLALDLARTESTFEFVSLLAEYGIQAAQASSGGGFLGFSGLAAGAVSAGLMAGVLAIRGVQQKNRTAELRLKWIDIFKNSGIGFNFAHYITSVADYNNYVNDFPKNYRLRFLTPSPILKEGNYNINNPSSHGHVIINNIDREKSLLINLGESAQIDGIKYPQSFLGLDNTNAEPPENTTLKSTFGGTAANIYATLKVWKPSQYGTLNNIKWIDITGCNMLNGEPAKVNFGGDTFISKYSYKRKFNFFLVSAMNQADYTPFKYSQYFNVTRPKYFINYDSEEKTLGMSLIPIKDSTYQLKDVIESGKYIANGKFFHYQYGIPYFFVESTINCWNRYAGTELSERFYPLVGDYIEWTQENKVSIRKPNVLKYNYTYSYSGLPKSGNFLPNNFNSKFYNCTNNSPNGIMSSTADVSEKQKVDPWLVYKNFDFYNFPTANGKLIDLLNIESTQILGIFENRVSMFNAIDTLKDRVAPETAELGTGGVFAQRPKEFHATDLGYAGAQHKASVSNEFGHFWVDARRGQVHQVTPNGEGATEITQGMRNWFMEHLPFKILKGKIEGLSDLDLDNPFKNIGISMGWDSRHKRLFLTKLDYIVKPAYIGKLEYVTREGMEEPQVDLDFLSTNKYIRVKETKEEVMFENAEVFEPVHFTLAYSPIFKSWISYYDFTPSFYINYNGFFSTGYTTPTGTTIWSHLLTNKSYGVFNGVKYGWKVEVPTKQQYTQKMLTNVEYWIDSLRYHNEYDYAANTKLGIDRAMIYNNTNSSGMLNLVTKEKNNRYQITQYPKVTLTGTDILTSFDEGKWSFNDFFNRVEEVNSNLPLWNYDKNAIEKTPNPKAITYKNRWMDRIRGDWFLIRFEGGSDSRYKQMFKWVDPKDNIII